MCRRRKVALALMQQPTLRPDHTSGGAGFPQDASSGGQSVHSSVAMGAVASMFGSAPRRTGGMTGTSAIWVLSCDHFILTRCGVGKPADVPNWGCPQAEKDIAKAL